MKRLIILLCLLLAGCSVQTPDEENNSVEINEPKEPDKEPVRPYIPPEPEEQTIFVGDNYKFEKVDLPVATYDGKPSKTYLYKNRPEIIDDLNGLSYTKYVWGDGLVDKNDENYAELSLLNSLHTILYGLSNPDDIDEKFENIFLNYPEALAENAYVEDTDFECTDKLYLNDKEYILDYPVSGYSKVYDGEKVRQLYQRLYNEPCPLTESVHVEIFDWYVTYSYDKKTDVFTYYQYRDGAIAGYHDTYLKMLDNEQSDYEIEFTVAALRREKTWLDDTMITMYYKNNGLPILERHFSDESRSDGKLTLSEMIKDQKENLDIYKVRAKINEDGTYTIIDYENMTPMHEAKDVIFYMNYVCEREDNSQLLPLFDTSYAYDANSHLLWTLQDGNKRTGFYEDDINAVIWVESSSNYEPPLYDVYVVDKVKHEMKQVESEDSRIYQKIKSDDQKQDADFYSVTVFEMNGVSYVHYRGEVFKLSE